MSDHGKTEETKAAPDGPDTDRREALIKIGKYAAYTAPAMMVTISTAQAAAPMTTIAPISRVD